MTRALDDVILDRFLGLAQERDASLSAKLGRGLPEEEVEHKLNAAGFVSSAELRVWYSRLGEAKTRDLPQVGPFLIRSLPAALDRLDLRYETHVSQTGLEGTDYAVMLRDWVPIVGTDWGDDVVVEGGTEPFNRARMSPHVDEFFPGDKWLGTQSMGELVRWWIDALEHRVWDVDPCLQEWTWNSQAARDRFPDRAVDGLLG